MRGVGVGGVDESRKLPSYWAEIRGEGCWSSWNSKGGWWRGLDEKSAYVFPSSCWLTPKLSTAEKSSWGAKELNRFQLLHHTEEPEVWVLQRWGEALANLLGFGLRPQKGQPSSKMVDKHNDSSHYVKCKWAKHSNKKTKTITSGEEITICCL